jgi:integrase
LLAVTVGLRRGELIGLRREDLDLTRGTLTVCRTQTRTATGRWIIGEVAKTDASHRMIHLPAICLEALRGHRARQNERRLQLGPAWQDEGAVFDAGDGRHLPSPNRLDSRFPRLTAQLGLPRIKLHGLRHTAATNMLKSGVPVHVVAHILGHANPSITLKVYAWVLADMQESAAARIDAMFA